MTQQKIADASKPHQKLIPVHIRGVPICIRGVRQKNLHMGRHITHNEVVPIQRLTYILIKVESVSSSLSVVVVCHYCVPLYVQCSSRVKCKNTTYDSQVHVVVVVVSHPPSVTIEFPRMIPSREENGGEVGGVPPPSML